MIRRIVNFFRWIVRRLFSGRRGSTPQQPNPPLTNEAVNVERLGNPSGVRYPIQEIFSFPLQESHISLDAHVWDGLRLSLPVSYTIPDPEFARALSVNVSVRTLRWALGGDPAEPVSILLPYDSWNPPYVTPVVERIDDTQPQH